MQERERERTSTCVGIPRDYHSSVVYTTNTSQVSSSAVVSCFIVVSCDLLPPLQALWKYDHICLIHYSLHCPHWCLIYNRNLKMFVKWAHRVTLEDLVLSLLLFYLCYFSSRSHPLTWFQQLLPWGWAPYPDFSHMSPSTHSIFLLDCKNAYLWGACVAPSAKYLPWA